MRLTKHIHLVGSGKLGFGISNELDCHVYLIDGGSECALIDAGVGLNIDAIIENVRADGIDVAKVRHVYLTHAHADHAGGCKQWKDRFGVSVSASVAAATFISQGDETGISLAAAKAGGFYPQEYRFSACPVNQVLKEGDTVKVGALTLKVLETPGHCMGMLSFLLSVGGKSYLFSGDTVFHSGKILLTNVYDCDLQQYVSSLHKLGALQIDGLLPGHFSVVLNGAVGHLRQATDCLGRMALPPNIL